MSGKSLYFELVDTLSSEGSCPSIVRINFNVFLWYFVLFNYTSIIAFKLSFISMVAVASVDFVLNDNCIFCSSIYEENIYFLVF